MKKRIKPSWNSLTTGEKMGVLIIYLIGFGILAKILGMMYLSCPLFW